MRVNAWHRALLWRASACGSLQSRLSALACSGMRVNACRNGLCFGMPSACGSLQDEFLHWHALACGSMLCMVVSALACCGMLVIAMTFFCIGMLLHAGQCVASGSALACSGMRVIESRFSALACSGMRGNAWRKALCFGMLWHAGHCKGKFLHWHALACGSMPGVTVTALACCSI